jgi:hypothetical protein
MDAHGLGERLGQSSAAGELVSDENSPVNRRSSLSTQADSWGPSVSEAERGEEGTWARARVLGRLLGQARPVRVKSRKGFVFLFPF